LKGAQQNVPGFNAGWFLLRLPALNNLFRKVALRCKNGKQDCICVEQPYFCDVVFEALFQGAYPEVQVHFAKDGWFEINVEPGSL
jgi:hypothetical protein